MRVERKGVRVERERGGVGVGERVMRESENE